VDLRRRGVFFAVFAFGVDAPFVAAAPVETPVAGAGACPAGALPASSNPSTAAAEQRTTGE